MYVHNLLLVVTKLNLNIYVYIQSSLSLSLTLFYSFSLSIALYNCCVCMLAMLISKWYMARIFRCTALLVILSLIDTPFFTLFFVLAKYWCGTAVIYWCWCIALLHSYTLVSVHTLEDARPKEGRLWEDTQGSIHGYQISLTDGCSFVQISQKETFKYFIFYFDNILKSFYAFVMIFKRLINRKMLSI